MKHLRKISGIFVLVAAGVLLVTLAGCDHDRYDVRVRGDHCGPPVRYSEYHYVAPPRVYDRSVVVVRDRDDGRDRSYSHDRRDGDRRDRDDHRSYDRHDRHDRRR